MRLSGKVSIVTGGGSGIGRVTASLFAAEGAKVVIADLDERNGRETVESIEKAGGEGLFIRTDVASTAETKRMADLTVERHGRIDVLANVAGIFREGGVVETSEDVWRHILDVNLTGVFLCMKHCVPYMIRQGGGSVVNISSEAGLVGIANMLAYGVSKSGVISLTKSAAVDLAPHRVRVNCVCPGRVNTPLVEKVIAGSPDPEKARRALSEDRPMMRMGRPEEIAAGILYLASDESPYATGAVLSIDGGYTAR
jgi:NAD(P)-dependent dehydrogenase (short-subunit alcohol dehydrogenase family)